MCVWNVSEEDRLCKYCLLYKCEERGNKGSRRNGKVMPTMRAMEPKEEKVFGLESYNACRTAASRLSESFGCRFYVRMEADGIHVLRAK